MLHGCLKEAEGRYCLDSVMCTQTAWERNRGLLGRDSLQGQQGMWIIPCNSVHTIGMAYALDLVYLAKDLTVIKVVKNVKPWRMSGAIGAFSIVELAAGTADRLALEVGHHWVWKEHD